MAPAVRPKKTLGSTTTKYGCTYAKPMDGPTRVASRKGMCAASHAPKAMLA
jgi:hypothetical protein